MFRSSPSRPFTLFLFFFFFTAELGSPGMWYRRRQQQQQSQKKKHYIREPNSSGIEISCELPPLLRFFLLLPCWLVTLRSSAAGLEMMMGWKLPRFFCAFLRYYCCCRSCCFSAEELETLHELLMQQGAKKKH